MVFAVRARGLRGGRLAAVGAACFVLALGWWFAVVPSDWRRWRAQWAFGHVGHFVVTFAGFLALPGATVDRWRLLVSVWLGHAEGTAGEWLWPAATPDG